MKISPANVADAVQLTALTMRSKSHWGYSPDQMEMWREELTITENYISQHHVFVLRSPIHLSGYYSFCELLDQAVELDNLFVDPQFMGQGLGKKLMQDCLNRVQSMGYRKISLYADPNAEEFYQKFGFGTTDQLTSSVPGRTLPVMELQLR